MPTIEQYTLPEDPLIRAIVLKRALAYKASHFRSQYYNPHAKQRIAQALDAEPNVAGLFGGQRTGKSMLAAAETTYHLTGLYPEWWEGRTFHFPTKVWVASESQELTRDGAQTLLLGDLAGGKIGTGTIPLELLGRKTMKRGISDAVDTIRVKHSSGGWSELGFKAYNQGREPFQSVTRDYIWLDEEPPEDIYNECSMRVMSAGGYMLLAFTPLSGMSNVCVIFLADDKAESVGMVNMSWADNPYLPPEMIADLEARMLPHEREARQFGKPIMGSGLIWPVPSTVITCDPFQPPKYWPRGVTMDFGWTAPTGALCGAIEPESDTLYVWWEYKVAEQPPLVHAAAVNAIVAGGSVPVWGDPAGQQSGQKDGDKLIEEYRTKGNLHIELANNEVHAGLVRVYHRMITGKLKIFSTCQTLLAEIRMYHYDQKGKVKGDQDDHLCDCLRYLCAHAHQFRVPRPAGFKPGHGATSTHDGYGSW